MLEGTFFGRGASNVGNKDSPPCRRRGSEFNFGVRVKDCLWSSKDNYWVNYWASQKDLSPDMCLYSCFTADRNVGWDLLYVYFEYIAENTCWHCRGYVLT